MNVLEKEIEDIVFQSDNTLLRERGLGISGVKFRQVGLGDYGIADIVTLKILRTDWSWDISIQIVELKKEIIDSNTLMQAARYCKGLKLLIHRRFKINRPIDFSFVIIGKKLQTNGDFCYLLDVMPNLQAYTYSIDLVSGIKFKREIGYGIIDAAHGTLTHDANDIISDMVKEAIKNKING